MKDLPSNMLFYLFHMPKRMNNIQYAKPAVIWGNMCYSLTTFGKALELLHFWGWPEPVEQFEGCHLKRKRNEQMAVGLIHVDPLK